MSKTVFTNLVLRAPMFSLVKRPQTTARIGRNQLFSRSIVRLIKKDKELSSFDVKDAPLEPVNPFNLPAPINNAAGTFSTMKCVDSYSFIYSDDTFMCRIRLDDY